MSLLRRFILSVVLGLGCVAGAQVSNTVMGSADAMLCTGSSNYQSGADLRALNFGDAGALAIAPAASAKGEFRSLLKFHVADSLTQFDSAFGSNNWSITGVSLELTSNYGTAGVQPNHPIFNVISGGRFVIEWLANDDWLEGTGTPNLPTTDGVGFNSLPLLLTPAREPLCTNLYSPPGNNVHVTWPLPLTRNLVADIAGGGDVTFHLYAADEQIGYLFNSYRYGRGNEPFLHIVATPVLKILSGTFTNGAFQLAGLGNHHSPCYIQASSNLSMSHWETIGTALTDAHGGFEYADFDAVRYPQRYYRLSQ